MFREAGRAETGRKRLSLERIEEPARCIDPVFLGSPQYEAEALGDELGLSLVCKVETANPIRSWNYGAKEFMEQHLNLDELGTLFPSEPELFPEAEGKDEVAAGSGVNLAAEGTA